MELNLPMLNLFFHAVEELFGLSICYLLQLVNKKTHDDNLKQLVLFLILLLLVSIEKFENFSDDISRNES